MSGSIHTRNSKRNRLPSDGRRGGLGYLPEPLLAAPLLTVRGLRHRALLLNRVEISLPLGRREHRERLLGSLRVRVRADALELAHGARELRILPFVAAWLTF
jgi:hypothetical protein